MSDLTLGGVKLKARILYLITFLLLSLFFIRQTWSAEWGFRGLFPRGTGYYDKSSIKKINSQISQVWTATLYNEQGKADAFSILKRQDKAPDNPDILYQESTLMEFDCANGKFRITAINIYDEKDNLLLSVPDINGNWHDIVPNSINEKLKNIVCNAEDASTKKK